jgi:hypothetical protein
VLCFIARSQGTFIGIVVSGNYLGGYRLQFRCYLHLATWCEKEVGAGARRLFPLHFFGRPTSILASDTVQVDTLHMAALLVERSIRFAFSAEYFQRLLEKTLSLETALLSLRIVTASTQHFPLLGEVRPKIKINGVSSMSPFLVLPDLA